MTTKGNRLGMAAAITSCLVALAQGALIDASDGANWSLATGSSITLCWNTDWFTNEVSDASFTASGMVVRANMEINPAAGEYVWQPALGDAAEDVCDIRLTFRDSAGNDVERLEATLAVSKNGFRMTRVLPDCAARNWQATSSGVLFPWDTAWIGGTNAAGPMTLRWSGPETNAIPLTASFGMYPFPSTSHAKGIYNLSLDYLDSNGTARTCETGTVRTIDSGFGLFLR